MAPNRVHDFGLPLTGKLVCVAHQYGITTLHFQKSMDIQKHCFRIMLRGSSGHNESGHGPQPVPVDSV